MKNGDGAADVKPIAHLYKTQVYALARHWFSGFARAWWSLGASLLLACMAFTLVLLIVDRRGFFDALQIVPRRSIPAAKS